MNINLKKSITLILGLVFCASFMFAEGLEKGKKKPTGKISGQPTVTKLNINNISTFFSNNGYSDEAPTGDSGFQYPKGSGRTVFFVSGFLWGGSVNGNWRVGGSAYRIGLKGGRVLPDGTAENEELEHVRVYRVRADYKNFTTPEEMAALYTAEVADEGLTAEQIYNQYDLDWQRWPAQYGAPFIDKDGNGVYDPDKDVPGMSEDPSQTIWAVANDLSEAATTYMYGALPMQIEYQATYWAYKTSGALGNTLFRKYLIINKNTAAFDSMYLCMWSDPDLGGAFDDFAGVDTVLSLGYVYNAVAYDDIYKDTPPAAGFDFFQGPRIPGGPSDSAKYRGKWLKGYIGMPATSFFMFSQGQDANWSDPGQGSYLTGALYWRNLFQGKLARDGVPYTDPNTGRQTKWPLSGDPLTGTGWVDGQMHAKNDRRFGLVSGPFTMNPGDTQEVVVGELVGGGTPGIGNRAAVSVLKFFDKVAQNAYDVDFNIATPPPAPGVKVSEFSDHVVLNWSDIAQYGPTESFKKAGYTFEGYNVYQLPSANATIEEATRVATFDVMNGISVVTGLTVDQVTGVEISKVFAFGNDMGIQRTINLTQDYIKTLPTMYAGTRYYFAVTAYAYNPNAIQNILESPFTIYTVTPQSPVPGTRYLSTVNQALTVTHSAGGGVGTVDVVVTDPLRVNGHNYKVEFQQIWYKQVGSSWIRIADTTGVTDPVKFQNEWFVKDMNTGLYVISNQNIYSQLDISKADPVAGSPGQLVGDGTNTADGFKINIAGTFDYPESFSGFELNGVALTDHGEDWRDDVNNKWRFTSGTYWGYGSPSFLSFGQGVGGTTAAELQDDFELRFTGVKAIQNIGGVDREVTVSGGSMATYYNVPEGLANFPLNPNPGTNANFLVRVPFEVWNIVTNQQITCIVRKRESGSVWQAWNSSNGARMYMDIVNIPYSETMVLNAANADQWQPYCTWWLGTYKTDYVVGDVIKVLIPNSLVTGQDEFSFTTPTVTTGDAALAKEDVNAVNVFPNPYYGANPQEINKYNRFVTFTHLPAKATIKIFNISGQLIRTIEKDSPGQFQRWDLATDSGLPAPSGIFVAYIDMPEQGVVKKLKVAIIQEQQILDRF